MSAAPTLSVIVPVYRGGSAFRRSLEALRASRGLEADDWELVVVVDGDDPESEETAKRYADRVERVDGGPTGPANARNVAAATARGDILVFVDADVLVHADTLVRIRDVMTPQPGVVAVFGAYDEFPGDPGFFSQYRNLYHRHVHLEGAGEAETFWAGCGAVRASAFREVGGFDAAGFPRPQIEDIDLGYRLRDRGGRILLDPSIQASHLKRWTFGNIVRTDLLDRGIPWMRLLIQRGATRSDSGATLNVRSLEKMKTAFMGLASLLVVLAIVLGRMELFGASMGFVALVVGLNFPTYAWFAALRGWGFAVRVIPMNLLYYLISGCSVVFGWGLEAVRPGSRLRGESGAGGPTGSSRPTPAEDDR